MVFGKYSIAVIVFLVFNLFCDLAFATDPALLDPGDVVYKTGWFGVTDVEKVMVVRINKSSNKVKIRDLNTGVTEWVNANKLYTKDELSSKRWKTAGEVLVGVGKGLRQAKIDNITKSCKAHEGLSFAFSLKAMSLKMKTYPHHAICKCVATNIVNKESNDVIKLIEKDFENVEVLGEKKYEEYLSPCIDKYFREERPVIPPGYVYDEKTRNKKWTPDIAHPSWPHIKSAEKETFWNSDPGYVFVDPKKSLEVKWKPEIRHNIYKKVFAGAKEGEWVAEPGYELIVSKKGTFTVKWKPGLPHRNMKNVVAATYEGTWDPAPGYSWVKGNGDGYVPKWKPGKAHSIFPNVIAHKTEGKWLPAKGYKWVDNKSSELSVVRK